MAVTFTRIRQLLTPLSPPPSRPAASIPRVKHQTVGRDASPLWYVRGWRQDSGRYFGDYRSNGQQYRGELFANRDGTYQPYIFNPPARALDGPHNYCFLPQHQAGYYRIHLCYPARSIDDAIRAVEVVLS